MAAINSDRELLEHLGLTENEAANFLYRSRQTVNQALQKGDKYFRPCDVLALRLAADHKADRGLAGQVIDIDLVSDYMALQWGPEAAERVRTGYGAITEALDPTGYDEIWVVLPNASHVTSKLPDQAELLRSMPGRAPQTAIVYMFGSPLEARSFENQLDSGEAGLPNVRFLSESLVGAQLTMVIGNPRQRGKTAEFWVLSRTGFQRAVNTSPDITTLHLQDTIPKLAKLAPFKPTKALMTAPARAKASARSVDKGTRKVAAPRQAVG